MFERVPWYIHKDKNTKINLSNNICYDQIHALKVSELIRENGNGFSQYANEPKIYEDLSEFYGVPKTNIAIGMGLGELIPRIFNIFRDKTFSIVTPTWMMATGFCEVNCIKYYQGLDLRADVLYVANPNGQDGQVIDRDILESLCDAFEYVIIDEAYADFCVPTCSVIDLAITRNNVLVCKTFSKSLALPGLRFGYCFGNHHVIWRLQQLRPSGVVNTIVERIGPELLSMIDEHVIRMVDTRDYIESKYECSPSNANFVLLKNKESFLDRFQYRTINGLHRMSLMDLDTFKSYESLSDVHESRERQPS